MIGTWLLPRLDIPLGRDVSGRFLPWIIALMVYLSALGGVALVLLGDTLGGWNRSLAATMTLQLPAETSVPRIETALAALRQTPGVVAVHELTPAETAGLIRPWLGDSMPISSLPLPHLIDIRIDPKVRIDFTTLRSHLRSIDQNAQLDGNQPILGQLQHLANQIQGVIAAGMAVVALLLVLTVVFAARIGLSVHQPVVEILHLLGAPDRYIARQFQTHALWLGLRGGVAGAAAAAVTIVVLGRIAAGVSLPLPAASADFADWRPWALLAGAALAAGLVAMITARATILRRLARMP